MVQYLRLHGATNQGKVSWSRASKFTVRDKIKIAEFTPKGFIFLNTVSPFRATSTFRAKSLRMDSTKNNVMAETGCSGDCRAV